MSLQFGAAKAISATLTWGLRRVFHRPAANTPGKIALYVDPCVIAHARPRLSDGSVVVVGTNGKTTVTNLLADVVERSGRSVVCNRTGANLDSGVATVLLQSKGAHWGVFESDELWLAKILPHLQANYVVLLNLFRDQLDRCGEIDRIQDSIVGALATSPGTVLVYNADDPLCTMIAQRAAELPGREGTRSIAFGVGESMGLEQNEVADATMCQRCSSMFEYAFRQYGQLGEYHCPTCGFARPTLDFEARDVRLGATGLSFGTVRREDAARGLATGAAGSAAVGGAGAASAGELADTAADGAGAAGAYARPCANLGETRADFSGAYMVYNLLAVRALAHLLGCSADDVQCSIEAFDPRNGRLQEYEICGRHVLLNLAKNPTGFNQNLKIVAQDEGPKAVAFFVNDKEGDGRDISWIWDIDFEELAEQGNCVVFAGGIRRNDLQVRLKYAGVPARLVDGIKDVFEALPGVEGLPADAGVYAIANYTALPVVHADLDAMAAAGAPAADAPGASAATAVAAAPGSPSANCSDVAADSREAASDAVAAAADGATAADVAAADAGCEDALVIAHMFPDLLNLYGDGGNVRVLVQRCRWRGIPVEVRRVNHGEGIDLSDVDLMFLGGGPDREQRLASEGLMLMRDDIGRFIEDDGVVLAVCGGYQILGHTWLLGDEEVPGLGVVDFETRRFAASPERLIDNIVLRSPLAKLPVVGYENHAGRTTLGSGVEGFGAVVSSTGKGNNDTDKVDGVRYRNVVGTYAHGPLLPKNPEVADVLLARALDRHARRTGRVLGQLAALDDAEEAAANAYMRKRLGVSG